MEAYEGNFYLFDMLVMMPFLQYQGSRPGLFYNLSVGEFYPLRILASSFGAVELRFPPLIRREKTKSSHQVSQKRHHHDATTCRVGKVPIIICQREHGRRAERHHISRGSGIDEPETVYRGNRSESLL